jgi:hypothetical protein
MTRLPLELVARIIAMVEEVEYDDLDLYPFEWWIRKPTYYRFLDNASLVCKDWNTLCESFRTSYTIPGNSKQVSPEAWEGGFARNGNELSKRIPVRRLHIEWMEDDKEDQDFVLVLPLSFKTLLTISEHPISSLSLQGELLQLGIPKNSLGCDVILQRMLKRVEHLHVYSSTEGFTEYERCIAPGYEIQWDDLANAVWGEDRKSPLKSLALSTIAIDKPARFDDLPPCPARSVILEDAFFETIPPFASLFPHASHLVIQTSDFMAVSEPMTWCGLDLNCQSPSLQHLQLTWGSPYVLPPLQPKIFTSPGLSHLEIHCKPEVQESPQDADVILETIEAIFSGYSQNLEWLCIDGVGQQYRSQILAKLTSALKDRHVCPQLSREPVREDLTSKRILVVRANDTN